MEPVRVKLYRLFPVTKRRYAVQLAVTVILLLGLVCLRWFLPEVQVPEGNDLPLHTAVTVWFLKHLWWIVAGLAVLVFLEAAIVFRCFAQAEARQPS